MKQQKYPAWNTGSLQGLKQDEGLLAISEKHFHGTEGWKKKKKRIYTKMKAIGRMNWTLRKARMLVSSFDEDILLTDKFEFH
uniref:Uncharacterized protein n=1 Tax=Onchocerca volvulus TaxID=6282 RepID=A0A8R1TRY3_ONCVO